MKIFLSFECKPIVINVQTRACFITRGGIYFQTVALHMSWALHILFNLLVSRKHKPFWGYLLTDISLIIVSQIDRFFRKHRWLNLSCLTLLAKRTAISSIEERRDRFICHISITGNVSNIAIQISRKRQNKPLFNIVQPRELETLAT